jgi:DNA polymerase
MPRLDDVRLRAARQQVETARLMGVDFVPVRVNRPAPDPGAARPTVSPVPPPAAGSDRAAALAKLRAEHDATCPHCTRATAHTQTVFGDGSPDATLMFVGEAPGAEEDRQGIPFVGASGKKLTEMIRAMGFERSDVYIANVLKARPPDNATPTPEEAANCGPFLRRQIEIIRPRVLVTLGKPAVAYLLDTRETMTSLRGRWFEYRGIPLMPTFHPAFLLRQYTPENRAKVWSDLKRVIEKLEALGCPPPRRGGAS